MIIRKTKVYAIISAIILLVSVAVVIMMLAYITSQGEELALQAKEVADYSAREQTYRELSLLVDETKKDHEELQTYLLTEEGTINFLTMAENLAKEGEVELVTDVLKVEEKEKSQFDTLTITFSTKGMKSRVYSFVKLLETLPYNVRIESISIQAQTESQTEIVEGKITLTASIRRS